MEDDMEHYPLVYAVKHKDFQVRLNSRSGGIFTAISDYVFSQGGVIYGCVLDDSFNAVHVRACNAKERDAMRGSKYIQSDISNIYRMIAQDLKDGLLVLVTGTSCQIQAIKTYIGDGYRKQIIYLDIVCHGVPSSRVWHDYIHWQEEKKHAKCDAVDFRNKKDFGWAAHIETVYTSKGKIDSEVYAALFYKHHILRPACYQCPYKSVNHPGNITIADYWGIEKAAEGFSDNQGVSLVLVNDSYGEELLENVCGDIQIVRCQLEDSIQPPLKGPFPEPADRSEFWDAYNAHDFSWIAKKYGNHTWRMQLRKQVKYLLWRLAQKRRVRGCQ